MEHKKLIWKKLPPTPPDPILNIWMKCLKDPRPYKVNLTAGIYKDENLRPFVIEPIKILVKELTNSNDTSIYDPIESIKDTRTADLLIKEFFDENNKDYQKALAEDRVCRYPCQSGGNGLYFGFKLYTETFQKKYAFADNQIPTVWLSNPSWPIHQSMSEMHGYNIKYYNYYNSKTCKMEFEVVMKDLSSLKKGDLLLIQTCGHNPTGFDPSSENWHELVKLIKEKEAIVFFDFAYMGFATGDIEKDSYGIKLFLKENIEFYLTFSCAKNFGLYSLRVGFFMTVHQHHEDTKATNDFIQKTSRQLFDRPTSFGQMVVRNILSDKDKRLRWHDSFKLMNQRLTLMRHQLVSGLKELGSKINWDFLIEQTGMFAYTGLTKGEIEELMNNYAIFMISSGRISMAGLNHENVGIVAHSFHEVTKKRGK